MFVRSKEQAVAQQKQSHQPQPLLVSCKEKPVPSQRSERKRPVIHFLVLGLCLSAALLFKFIPFNKFKHFSDSGSGSGSGSDPKALDGYPVR
jgi:hypothetical protein